MLLLVDLDNTLIDRAGAFAHWAALFAGELDGVDARAAASWTVEADRGGYAPRPELAAAMRERFGLSGPLPELIDRIVYEHVEFVAPYEGVPARLEAFAAAGARIVIVTNGPVEQQSRKLRRTGVDRHATAVVISEGIGVKKPDRRIFEEALRRAVAAGVDPDDGPIWMVGDDVRADMAGARALGMRTGWIAHGREWPHEWHPTVSGATAAEVLDLVRDSD
ncbi:MAG: HAD family hydrolase [Herbiconiux sp.]|nr:HAD family hydrolase [Herbiconiux sp.]